VRSACWVTRGAGTRSWLLRSPSDRR
jgi:hypothetical protein